jgi:acetaldehyde dehydrogenase (acetylating)
MIDTDLLSIQEARSLVRAAKEAQTGLAELDQRAIDDLVEAISRRCAGEAERLARMAMEETGFGRWQDKMQKNLLASDKVWNHIRNMKTIGLIREDKERRILEVAAPVGVIAALVPSTNPTSTTIYKALISLKAGNAVVFSPHPSALECIHATVEVIQQVLKEKGLSENLITAMRYPSIDGTRELMQRADLIIATGGPAMVKAAYSSGTPALGVGAGNVPVFIERSADVDTAVRMILESKLFDNGTVCASEQAIIVEQVNTRQVRQKLEALGGYFLRGDALERVKRIMEKPNGAMNPAIVGQTAQTVAKLAGITIPESTRLLISDEPGVGPQFPFSKEKLTALIGYYEVEDWHEACELCFALLKNGGIGHSLAIHSNNESIIREFALKKPVSRLLVNTPATHGAVGLTTNLAPALTLGCGAVGGSSISDNVDPSHLINIRKVAYGVACSPEQCTQPAAGEIDIAQLTQLIIAELRAARNRADVKSV